MIKTTKALRNLAAIFEQHGYEIRIVGGMVTWNIGGRSAPTAWIHFGLFLLNLMFGIMQVATHPEIWS